MPGVETDLPCAAYTGDEPFAFISYAHRDAADVYPEIQRLDLMGYRVWYDEGIDPGNEWPEEVAGALKRCSQFIVFVTPRSIDSRNVRNEINYALKLDKPFFAIHLTETELPAGMDLQMSSIQAIFMWRMNEQTYIRNIERAIPRMAEASPQRHGSECSDEGELVELFARTLYSDHQKRMKASDQVNWHQAELVLREQTLKDSRFLLSMLHIAGFNVTRAEESDSAQFSADVLDFLARMEHDRWSRERIEAGWRHGETKDPVNKTTPHLVAWSEMDEAIRTYDREAVRHIPQLLLRSGYWLGSMYEHPERSSLFNLGEARDSERG